MIKRRFIYDAERARENFRRRTETGFDGLLFRVLWFDDSKPLIEYLLSNEPLDREERAGLAWMLEKKLEKPRRGRRRGSRSQLHRDKCRMRRVFRRRREAEWAADGRKRLPKGRLPELAAQVLKEYQARYPERENLQRVTLDEFVLFLTR